MHCNKYLIRVLFLLLMSVFAGCASTPKEAATQPAAQVSAEEQNKKLQAAKAIYQQAVNALNDGKQTEAESLFISMTKAYPEFQAPFVNLGIIFFKRGELQESEEMLKKAVALAPDQAVPYNQLGILYRSQGRFQESREQYEQAIKLNPDYAFAHYNLGILFDLYLGEVEKALYHYQQFQRLNKEEDKQVGLWVKDLQMRMKASLE